MMIPSCIENDKPLEIKEVQIGIFEISNAYDGKSNYFKKVIPAPKWLKDQMERARKLPPPTNEEVERQWRGSIEQQLPQWLKKRKTSVGKDSWVR
jgi:hypothetical protein